MEYYNSSFYRTTESNRNYLENSYQYLKDATINSPNDLEALLYAGIASLYLSPSSTYDPLAEFDSGLKTLDNLEYIQKSPQANSIKSALWLGKGVAYLKIGALEDAQTCLRNARSLACNLSMPQNQTTINDSISQTRNATKA